MVARKLFFLRVSFFHVRNLAWYLHEQRIFSRFYQDHPLPPGYRAKRDLRVRLTAINARSDVQFRTRTLSFVLHSFFFSFITSLGVQFCPVIKQISILWQNSKWSVVVCKNLKKNHYGFRKLKVDLSISIIFKNNLWFGINNTDPILF